MVKIKMLSRYIRKICSLTGTKKGFFFKADCKVRFFSRRGMTDTVYTLRQMEHS